MSILVDTNLLVYAAMASSPHHVATRRWLDQCFDDPEMTVGLTWTVLYGFMRLVTNRRIVGTEAIGPAAAWAAAEAFRLQPNATIVQPGERHAAIAAGLMATPGLGSNDIPDVLFAATAIENGLVLCTHDHGFARFLALRWRNPLAGES